MRLSELSKAFGPPSRHLVRSGEAEVAFDGWLLAESLDESGPWAPYRGRVYLTADGDFIAEQTWLRHTHGPLHQSRVNTGRDPKYVRDCMQDDSRPHGFVVLAEVWAQAADEWARRGYSELAKSERPDERDGRDPAV